MSSSINPLHPRNSVTLQVNKHFNVVTPFTGYETQTWDAETSFSRDTGHKSTGYETQKHGIRGAHTGYGTRVSRDTGHAIHGIRDTAFTGYETQEKSLKWLETRMQQAFQDYAKIS